MTSSGRVVYLSDQKTTSPSDPRRTYAVNASTTETEITSRNPDRTPKRDLAVGCGGAQWLEYSIYG